MAERTRIATGLKFHCGVAALSLGFGAADAVLAQSSDDLTVDLGECVNLESAEERFACYEARVNAVLEEREPAAANEPADRPSEPAPQSARTRAESADASGVSDAGAAANDDGSDSNEVFGTITDLRETIPNSYLITLDNGQIWRQVRPKWYPLRPGLKVRIYPTRWGGSLRLTAVDGNGYIQVQRAR